MLTPSDILQARCANQHLSGNVCQSAAEVVLSLGAVQAQEYQPSLWGLGVRLDKGATKQSIINELADAKIVRTWLMRGTIHYAPAADVLWMARLMGARINTKYSRLYEQVDLTPALFDIGKRVLIQQLSGGIQATRKELYEAFEQAGITQPSKRGRGSFILQYWAQEGLLCFGPYRGKQQTFVLLSEWVPHTNSLSVDTALTTITERYFTGHGPATTADFAYWSGLSAAEAKRGVQLCGDKLDAIAVEGRTYWIVRRTGEQAQPKTPSILLLPCFDEYAVGYKDRSLLLDAQHRERLGYGINTNVVVADGRIVGSWQRNATTDVAAAISVVDTENTAAEPDIQRALDRYNQFDAS